MPTPDTPGWSAGDSLRQRAEVRLKLGPEDVAAMSPEQVQRLVYELQVHQIELQLQNEELRAAQAELTEVRDRLFELFELAPVGYVTVGPDFRIERCNLSAAELFGMERSKVEGAVLVGLVAPEDRDKCFLAVRQTLESGGRQTCECSIRPSSGGTKFVHLAIAPLVDSTPAAGCRLTMTNITARKHLEDQLRANEEQFRARVENIRECIWELDARGRFTYISPSFLELTGYSPEEFLGKTPAGLHADDDERRMIEWLLSGMASREPMPPIQARARRKDGQLYDVEFRATKQFSSTGEYLGARGISQDITDRKRAEESLKRFNEDLERQVQQRTAAIHMLRGVAVMANETQDPLLAAEYCLKQIATQHGWLCGHVWWIDGEDEKFLSPRCVWYPADTYRWDEFRTVTLQTRLRRNAELPGRAIAGGRPLWTTQLQRAMAAPRAAVALKLGLATAVAAPVFARGRPVAVLEFFSECQLPRDPRTIDVLTGVTLQLGRVFERREFEEHLLASTEDVRRGIAQDLHDDVGQELTGVSLMAAALAKSISSATPSEVKLLSDISACLSRTHEKLRRLCHNTMPIELREGKLIIALKQLAALVRDNSHIECDFVCELPEWEYDARSSTQLYRIAQEATSNAIRHARARRIRITMEKERGDILLMIEDDGMGLSDVLPANQGMGLQTMRYRAGMLGGTLEMHSGQDGGTRVVCRIPASLRFSAPPTAKKKATRCRRKS